ncbi:hypothetical protein DPMN_047384 [Dreissena polymorpha]|uniref:Uncharacterized protein n=1 Tax=Dreissena polymorpha TaxID=45954 RepID=A0A9D4D9P5_DREPO|nr:hypothetical protein DPMN_047384 [Dreissena polymorpha]
MEVHNRAKEKNAHLSNEVPCFLKGVSRTSSGATASRRILNTTNINNPSADIPLPEKLSSDNHLVDGPTDLPTDMSKAIYPLFFEGGHNKVIANRSSIFFLKVKGLSFSITKEGGCGGEDIYYIIFHWWWGFLGAMGVVVIWGGGHL